MRVQPGPGDYFVANSTYLHMRENCWTAQCNAYDEKRRRGRFYPMPAPALLNVGLKKLWTANDLPNQATVALKSSLLGF